MSHFATLNKAALMIVAGTLSGALVAGAASAATGESTAPSLVVRYSSESLANDTGVQDLYRRIVAASRQVCPAESVRDLATVARVQACREQAVSRAIAQIHNSRLAALHAASAKNRNG